MYAKYIKKEIADLKELSRTTATVELRKIANTPSSVGSSSQKYYVLREKTD